MDHGYLSIKTSAISVNLPVRKKDANFLPPPLAKVSQPIKEKNLLISLPSPQAMVAFVGTFGGNCREVRQRRRTVDRWWSLPMFRSTQRSRLLRIPGLSSVLNWESRRKDLSVRAQLGHLTPKVSYDL